MESGELESDFSVEIVPSRMLRATALIAASVVAIGATAVFYADPHLLSFARQAALTTIRGEASYRISAISFVDPLSGWIVADFSTGDFAVLHTDDGGQTWSRQ